MIEAAREVREQLLELAADELEAAARTSSSSAGEVRVKGSPEHVGRRSPSSPGAGRLHRQGLRRVPERPPAPGRAASAGSGMESFLAPQLFTHAARVQGRPRDGRRARARRSRPRTTRAAIVNPIGADGQVYGGVVMGIGQALSEGTQLDDEGRQRNPHLLDYKLATASDVPRIDVAWIETPDAERRPERLQGRRRAAVRADAGRDRERDRQGDRARACGRCR